MLSLLIWPHVFKVQCYFLIPMLHSIVLKIHISYIIEIFLSVSVLVMHYSSIIVHTSSPCFTCEVPRSDLICIVWNLWRHMSFISTFFTSDQLKLCRSFFWALCYDATSVLSCFVHQTRIHQKPLSSRFLLYYLKCLLCIFSVRY